MSRRVNVCVVQLLKKDTRYWKVSRFISYNSSYEIENQGVCWNHTSHYRSSLEEVEQLIHKVFEDNKYHTAYGVYGPEDKDYDLFYNLLY